MARELQQVYDGGLIDLKAAAGTASAGASTSVDFGVQCHELTLYNGSAATVYVAWDHQAVVDGAAPATTTPIKVAAATLGDIPVPPGYLFQRACRFRHVYIYATADTPINNGAAGCLVLLGARSGTAADY